MEAGVQRKVAESVRGVIGKHRCAVHHHSSRICPSKCMCIWFWDRAEWRLRHPGPLRARTEASGGIRLHHAQSHERSGELPILLTHACPEGGQPG